MAATRDRSDRGGHRALAGIQEKRAGNHPAPARRRRAFSETGMAALGSGRPWLCQFLPTRPPLHGPAALPGVPAPHASPPLLPRGLGPDASPQVRCTLCTKTRAPSGHVHPRAQAPDKRGTHKVASPEKTLAGTQKSPAPPWPHVSHVNLILDTN